MVADDCPTADNVVCIRVDEAIAVVAGRYSSPKRAQTILVICRCIEPRLVMHHSVDIEPHTGPDAAIGDELSIEGQIYCDICRNIASSVEATSCRDADSSHFQGRANAVKFKIGLARRLVAARSHSY